MEVAWCILFSGYNERSVTSKHHHLCHLNHKTSLRLHFYCVPAAMESLVRLEHSMMCAEEYGVEVRRRGWVGGKGLWIWFTIIKYSSGRTGCNRWLMSLVNEQIFLFTLKLFTSLAFVKNSTVCTVETYWDLPVTGFWPCACSCGSLIHISSECIYRKHNRAASTCNLLTQTIKLTVNTDVNISWFKSPIQSFSMSIENKVLWIMNLYSLFNFAVEYMLIAHILLGLFFVDLDKHQQCTEIIPCNI